MAKQGRPTAIRDGSGVTILTTWRLEHVKTKSVSELLGKFTFGRNHLVIDTDDQMIWRIDVTIESMPMVINVRVKYSATVDVTDEIEAQCLEDAKAKVFKAIDTLVKANDIPGNEPPEKKEEPKDARGGQQQGGGHGQQNQQGRPRGGQQQGGGGQP